MKCKQYSIALSHRKFPENSSYSGKRSAYDLTSKGFNASAVLCIQNGNETGQISIRESHLTWSLIIQNDGFIDITEIHEVVHENPILTCSFMSPEILKTL